MIATELKPKQSGTREWAKQTVNCCTGCSHDCLYCYAKLRQVNYRKVRPEDWHLERIREKDVFKKHKKYPGRVMFPSSHDISDHNWSACQIVLDNLLKAGNEVLVVSKPHLTCIGATCALFKDYRDNLIFRFSIGSCDDRVLSFWEPNAPSYEERKASLKFAFDKGFQTSVSMEPMLDSVNIDALISDLMPYVSDTIWIGKMNYLGWISRGFNEQQMQMVRKIKDGQTDYAIWKLYGRYQYNPKIEWKDSIKKVVGLDKTITEGGNM
jgi:DNA repair photolyase